MGERPDRSPQVLSARFAPDVDAVISSGDNYDIFEPETIFQSSGSSIGIAKPTFTRSSMTIVLNPFMSGFS